MDGLGGGGVGEGRRERGRERFRDNSLLSRTAVLPLFLC